MNSQNSIDNFLQSVCRFISTEEKAKDIQDELKDHIYSYIEEYTEDGMSSKDATTMALKQMGDPNSLSKLYKDKLCKANRIMRIISRLLLLFVYIISDFIYFSLGNYDNLQLLCSVILTITIFYPKGKSTTSVGRSAIKVSTYQVNLLNELFKSKNIEPINY